METAGLQQIRVDRRAVHVLEPHQDVELAALVDDAPNCAGALHLDLVRDVVGLRVHELVGLRRRHDELRRRRRELGTSGSRERRLRGVELITQQGDGLAVIGDFRAELRDRGVPSVHRAAVRASRSALQRAEGRAEGGG